LNEQSPPQPAQAESPQPDHRVAGDRLFYTALIVFGGSYVLLIAAMLLADMTYTTPAKIYQTIISPEIRYSIWLSLISCTLTTIASLWVAVPIGYLMSRYEFKGKVWIDALLDIPIVLPPLVIGLSLLILFRVLGEQGGVFDWLRDAVVFEVPGVILAQFMVACAFAVRTMRATFDQIPPRREQVALTLGCSRSQAFFNVVLPDAKRGTLAAATLAWARSLGEFGPILVFAGATPWRTEVLPTSVFLRMQAGDIEAALSVSLVMVLMAVAVLVLTRVLGLRKLAI
jgi:molybdate transport system permease protein